MTNKLLRDNKKTRWIMLFILAFLMFGAYVASDNIFAVETTLCAPTATAVESEDLPAVSAKLPAGKDFYVKADSTNCEAIECYLDKFGIESGLMCPAKADTVANGTTYYTINGKSKTYRLTANEYGEMASAYSIFNVYLLMLILGGFILDKKGIRFTGIFSTILMLVGIGMLAYTMFELPGSTNFTTVKVPLIGIVRLTVLPAILGIGIFGVGAEIAGITVTKAITKWFTGYELALAMGLQLALARLGTGLAYGSTAPIVNFFNGSVGMAVLVGLVLLGIGLLTYFIYCAYDKKLDKQMAEQGVANASSAEDEFHAKDMLQVFKDPAFWMIALLCMLFYAAVNPFLKFSTGLMVNKFGIPEDMAGLFPMILPMGCIVLTPLFGGICDNKGRRADLMILGAIIITTVHVLFAVPALNHPAIAFVLMVMLGIGFALLPSAMWPSIAKIMPLKLLGTAMALTFYIQNIGFILVPKIATGLKSNYVQFSLFFALLGCIAIVLALGVKILDRKKGYGLQLPHDERPEK